MISSISNPQIRLVRQLLRKPRSRKQESAFIVEGKKMFLEAPDDWIRKVYLSESLAASDSRVMEKARRSDWEVAADSVFDEMSDTCTPQGVLAVLHTPGWKRENFLRPGGLYIILEDLQDPGNLGTIFRTGEGAGIDGLLLTQNCVDPVSPKVVRATMGSIFRVPYLITGTVAQAAELLSGCRVRMYAAHLDGQKDYDEADYREGAAFLIGNEARGLSPEGAGAAQELIRIPMKGRVESLNAAMAAGILMYEAARQRRRSSVCVTCG